MLGPEECATQYERWSLLRLSAWRWSAVALPAALMAALAGIGALHAGAGPDRGTVALGMAGLVAAPYAVLVGLEARNARRLERARETHLRLMRLEREWLAMGDWELADRIALLLCAGHVRVDWVPTPLEASQAAFAAIGRASGGGRLVAYATRERLDRPKLEGVIGRAVIEGAQTLVLVAPAGADDRVREIAARGTPGLRLELWGLRELLTRSGAIAQPD